MGAHNVYHVDRHKAKVRASGGQSSTPPDTLAAGCPDALSVSDTASALSAGHRLVTADWEAQTAQQKLADSWVQFLGRFKMDWFCTLTFRRSIHPEAADKLFRVWISKLNRDLYGVRWYRKPYNGVWWFRALEWQKREVIHYHALLGDVNNLNHSAKRLFWMDEWFHLAGIARIDKISEIPGHQLEALNAYVSKYVSKGGEIDCSDSLRWYMQRGEEVEI